MLFDEVMLDLKDKHPKAVHFVYASRKKECQIIESFSDDGEPKGSSGVPTLNVLRGEDLLDVGLITVRYFGGTLLGVGGLVRAYTQAAQTVILNAREDGGFEEYRELVDFELEIPYAVLNQVQYWITRLGIIVRDRGFQSESVKLLLSTTQENKEEFFKMLPNLAYQKTC